MPGLTIRHMPEELYARLLAYAGGHSLSTTGADLIRVALDHLRARAAGAAARNASMTPEQRSAAGKRAVMAREAKRQARS